MIIQNRSNTSKEENIHMLMDITIDMGAAFGGEMSLTLVVYGSDDKPVSLMMDMENRMVFESQETKKTA